MRRAVHQTIKPPSTLWYPYVSFYMSLRNSCLTAHRPSDIRNNNLRCNACRKVFTTRSVYLAGIETEITDDSSFSAKSCNAMSFNVLGVFGMPLKEIHPWKTSSSTALATNQSPWNKRQRDILKLFSQYQTRLRNMTISTVSFHP